MWILGTFTGSVDLERDGTRATTGPCRSRWVVKHHPCGWWSSWAVLVSVEPYERKASVEELPRSGWPMGKSVGIVLVVN